MKKPNKVKKVKAVEKETVEVPVDWFYGLLDIGNHRP